MFIVNTNQNFSKLNHKKVLELLIDIHLKQNKYFNNLFSWGPVKLRK